tara:strand:- start:1585 stop:2322 length:738 start_codon:yes stop_codon:yes gene_type:complete
MPFEILIKTFLRPKCLRRLIRSIRAYYPDVTIRICDDAGGEEIKGKNIHFHRLPFMSGLAMGKNYMVSKCEAPYFITMDDDYIVIKETDLGTLHRVISSDTDIAVVAGRVKEFTGVIRYGMGHLKVEYDEVKGRKITRYYYGDNAPKVEIKDVVCVPCRMTPQLIMGDKRLWELHNIKWRDELKRAEHLPFFLDLPHNMVRCYVVPDVLIGHMPFKYLEYAKYKNNMLYHNMVYEHKIAYKVVYK